MKLKSLLKKSGYLSISFKRLKTNHIQVKAEINSVKGLFIIDTGASNSCIDLKLCDFYNISYEKSSEKASSATDQISNTMISKKGTKVRAPINNEVFLIDEWAPYYIEGLPKGEIKIKLELINPSGELIDSPFNPSIRTVILE